MSLAVVHIIVARAAYRQFVALLNRQLAVLLRGDEVVSVGADGFVYLGRIIRLEFDSILTRVGFGTGGLGDVEGRSDSIFAHLAGITAYRLLVTIIGECIRIGNQGYILVVLDDNDVLDFIMINRDCPGFHGFRRIPIKGFGIFLRRCAAEGLILNQLVPSGINVLTIPLILHRVAQVGALGVDHVQHVVGSVSGDNDFLFRSLCRIAIGPLCVQKINAYGYFRADLGCFTIILIDVVSVANTIFIILDGVRLFRQLPHGVEFVGAVVVNNNGVGRFIVGCGGILGFSPAKELVALIRAVEAQGSRMGQGYRPVILGELVCHAFISAIIGVVGQNCGFRLLAPDGGEGKLGHVLVELKAADLELVAGIIDLTIVGPAQEHLVRGCVLKGGALNIRVAAVSIANGVGILLNALAGILHDILNAVGIVGVKSNIAENLGVKVKGFVVALFVLGGPTAPGVASGHICFGHVGRQRGFVDGRTIGDLNGFRINSIHSQVRSTGNGRRSPLGVDGDIIGRHGAGEHILLTLAQLVVIPARKLIILGDSVRPVGGIADPLQALLVFETSGILRAVVDKFDLIGVTVVVELRAAVRIFVL